MQVSQMAALPVSWFALVSYGTLFPFADASSPVGDDCVLAFAYALNAEKGPLAVASTLAVVFACRPQTTPPE
jgi:hypothetical protein